MHERNFTKRYDMDITKILQQLNAISKHQNNNITETITQLNNKLANSNHRRENIYYKKDVYQITLSSIINPDIRCGGCNFSNISDG